MQPGAPSAGISRTIRDQLDRTGGHDGPRPRPARSTGARVGDNTSAGVSRRRQALPDRRAQLERELADVEARIQRGLDALLAGVDAAEELRARLKAEKARKAALTADLEALKGRRASTQLDDRRLREELRARVRDVRGLLGRNVPRTQQILRKLLVGRLECEAVEDGRRVDYHPKARGTFAELLPASLSTPQVVTPGGYSEGWNASLSFTIAGVALAA